MIKSLSERFSNVNSKCRLSVLARIEPLLMLLITAFLTRIAINPLWRRNDANWSNLIGHRSISRDEDQPINVHRLLASISNSDGSAQKSNKYGMLPCICCSFLFCLKHNSLPLGPLQLSSPSPKEFPASASKDIHSKSLSLCLLGYIFVDGIPPIVIGV